LDENGDFLLELWERQLKNYPKYHKYPKYPKMSVFYAMAFEGGKWPSIFKKESSLFTGQSRRDTSPTRRKSFCSKKIRDSGAHIPMG
jgi:hypothetical protein